MSLSSDEDDLDATEDNGRRRSRFISRMARA